MSVQSISLETLDDDHEEIGREMADSIQRWLDAEWMPQSIHRELGTICQQTYVTCRNQGEVDLMTIMMQTADDLNEQWDKYNADAFVNAWDITNYVSDFLTAKTGIQGCECTSKIY
jgi:hypothetical protein